jgi:hypothetical protein
MDLDEARELALSLMREHGLREWTFAFDNAKTRAGVCRSSPRQIGLSRPLTLLHSPAEVRNTILHEIAHALVGPRHGHDPAWRATAETIGCTATRCLPESVARIDGAWTGICPAGHEFTAHRRPRRVRSCRLCSPTFDPDAIVAWTRGGEPAPMHPEYLAELAQIRSGEPVVAPARLATGTRVRLAGTGSYAGRTGTIQSRRRTRYVVRLDDGEYVTAPFELVRR